MAPDDAALAWELAATANPHLGKYELDRIYVLIGIGETFAAIEVLITVIVRDRIVIGEDLLATVVAWLDCYVGQDAEQHLRQLVGDVQTVAAQSLSTADVEASSAAGTDQTELLRFG
jgi:hypothetical protein